MQYFILCLPETLLQQAETCTRLLARREEPFDISPPATSFVASYLIFPRSELSISAQIPLFEQELRPRLPSKTEPYTRQSSRSIFGPSDMHRFVTLCYCALDRQRCSKDLSAQSTPSMTTKYQCEAHRSDGLRCECKQYGAYLCTRHRRKHTGEEQSTCHGITDKGKSCCQPLRGASYCRDHERQEVQDVEMFDVGEFPRRQSADVEMGGM